MNDDDDFLPRLSAPARRALATAEQVCEAVLDLEKTSAAELTARLRQPA